jgi:site-specific recombinase XerC
MVGEAIDRDAAAIALMLHASLRVGEMAALTSKDITLLNNRRGQMTVRVKGKVR